MCVCVCVWMVLVLGGECDVVVMGGFWGMALHGIGVIRGGACGCGLWWLRLDTLDGFIRSSNLLTR